MEDQLEIKCKVCGDRFVLPMKTALRSTERNDGCIPCEKCGSHATVWDMDALREAQYPSRQVLC